jgi:hypothetical protein
MDTFSIVTFIGLIWWRVKGKAVAQHTYGGAAERGGIAPTHSRPRHLIWMSGRSHTPAALYAWGKDPTVPIGQEARQAQELICTQRLEEKSSCLCRRSNPDRPVMQSVARHYIDWVTPATKVKANNY